MKPLSQGDVRLSIEPILAEIYVSMPLIRSRYRESRRVEKFNPLMGLLIFSQLQTRPFNK
jgi:hypothetical protein